MKCLKWSFKTTYFVTQLIWQLWNHECIRKIYTHTHTHIHTQTHSHTNMVKDHKRKGQHKAKLRLLKQEQSFFQGTGAKNVQNYCLQYVPVSVSLTHSDVWPPGQHSPLRGLWWGKPNPTARAKGLWVVESSFSVTATFKDQDDIQQTGTQVQKPKVLWLISQWKPCKFTGNYYLLLSRRLSKKGNKGKWQYDEAKGNRGE